MSESDPSTDLLPGEYTCYDKKINAGMISFCFISFLFAWNVQTLYHQKLSKSPCKLAQGVRGSPCNCIPAGCPGCFWLCASFSPESHHGITGSLWVTSTYSWTTDARKAGQSQGCDWASLQAARGCQFSPECLTGPSRNLCFIPLAGTVSEKDEYTHGQRGTVSFIVRKGC